MLHALYEISPMKPALIFNLEMQNFGCGKVKLLAQNHIADRGQCKDLS